MNTRSCNLTLKITVDNEARVYKVRPVRPLPPNTAMELALHNGAKEYHVSLSLEGFVKCSCPGFDSHKHCKHVDCLTALGILNPDPLMEVRKLFLEMIQERQELEELRQRYKTVISHMENRVPGSCYGTQAPEPVIQAEPPAKPKRVRKPRTRKPRDGEGQMPQAA